MWLVSTGPDEGLYSPWTRNYIGPLNFSLSPLVITYLSTGYNYEKLKSYWHLLKYEHYKNPTWTYLRTYGSLSLSPKSDNRVRKIVHESENSLE